MQTDVFASELAREVAPDALERFLRYVVIDTQSDPRSKTYPSTSKQLDLSRLLVEELLELGLDDAHLDEHGYVLATLPATTAREVPTIGLIAHVDTVPGVSGAGVKPQVVRYEGGEVALPGDPKQVLRPEEMPELEKHVGHELVTSDGTTLLGADDKGGVAEIMAAVAYLSRHPELEHGPVRIGFTPDEEIGAGTDHFDIEGFGAAVAYTLDGSTAGEIQDETFSALGMTVTFTGRVVHPGSAKGILVNAVKLAADFVSRLPRDTLSPETTEEREGFVHPGHIEGIDSRCAVELIIRDFDEEKLAGHETLVRHLAEEAAATDPRASVEIAVKRQYRNMKAYLSEHPRAVEAADEAIRRAGLEPKSSLIRGGTDGARLSELGLPTPNLFTGGHEYHSLREWICVQDMGAAVATIVHLVQIWAEQGSAEISAVTRLGA
ncbi:MAG: peptidase T [Gaiellaceae bacterium]